VPCYQAQQADLKYLLALDPDRLLAPFLKEAGIAPLKPNYPNWESMGLDGHTAGHYLSALSMMYAATRQPELLHRIQYMLAWIDSCQQKNGDGYVGGIPDGKSLWNDIRNGKIDAGSFSLGNRWVPLYNLHKTFAGLRDAYLYAHQTKALDMLVKLTDWFDTLTQNLSDDQVQQILATEHGGLNEVFVQVGQLTGNSRYYVMAQRFSHRAILQPLIARAKIFCLDSMPIRRFPRLSVLNVWPTLRTILNGIRLPDFSGIWSSADIPFLSVGTAFVNILIPRTILAR